MSSRDLRLRVLATAVFVVALALIVVTARLWPIAPSLEVVALVVAAMLSETLAVEFSSFNFSVTYAVWAAATILLGPLAGGLTSGISSLPAAPMAKEKRVVRAVFNFGQLTLTGLCAGWVYVLSGGRTLLHSPLVAAEVPRTILPVVLLAITAFIVNSTLVSLPISIQSGSRVRDVWKAAAVWTIPTEAANTVLALALAQVVASEGVVGLALFIVPLMIARQFYERYVLLRRAYADTVRSLVAMVEAQDKYTRGHSERVAAYSVGIARRLGLAERRVERIELAALLHDLGKVGISKTILQKRSRLSDAEFEVIKAHPSIGAKIIEEVPFLSDLAAFVSSHHERIDGTGYGSQLKGDEIPMEARVLGVADAFDAMTSSRPYREAMGTDYTICELRRCAGRQFDCEVVETFVSALSAGDFPDAPLWDEVPDEAV